MCAPLPFETRPALMAYLGRWLPGAPRNFLLHRASRRWPITVVGRRASRLLPRFSLRSASSACLHSSSSARRAHGLKQSWAFSGVAYFCRIFRATRTPGRSRIVAAPRADGLSRSSAAGRPASYRMWRIYINHRGGDARDSGCPRAGNGRRRVCHVSGAGGVNRTPHVSLFFSP